MTTHVRNRPCKQAGCPNVTTNPTGYCQQHIAGHYREVDAGRGTSTERGYDARWHRARTAYLREHPLCVLCLAEDKVTTASIVDHIIPHRGDYKLMWDESNWQSLCAYHHNRKTVTQDGGLGRVETRGQGY